MDTLAFARENYPFMPVAGVAKGRPRDPDGLGCAARRDPNCDCRYCRDGLTLEERWTIAEERDERRERERERAKWAW